MSNGVYDVVFGPFANLLAGIIIFLFRKRRLIGCVLASVEIGLVVGSYVWMIFGAPSNIFNVGIPVNWPFWTASVVSITVSSLVAIAVIGYALLSVLSRESIAVSLKSRGLKIVS
jgi:Na+/proline symporter